MQKRVRLSERVHAGLEWAAAKGHIGGRPKVNRTADPDAIVIRRLRDEGQSYGKVAAELGRSKSDVYRVCMTLGCSLRHRRLRCVRVIRCIDQAQPQYSEKSE